jgi:hypothetical protein
MFNFAFVFKDFFPFVKQFSQKILSNHSMEKIKQLYVLSTLVECSFTATSFLCEKKLMMYLF